MHPSFHAATTPDRLAVVMVPGGATLSYRELDARSNQGAHLFRHLGLKAGDTVAFCFDNVPSFFELVWAAQRAGLFFVTVSSKLLDEEVAYILNDSGAAALVVSSALSHVGETARAHFQGAVFAIGQDGTDLRDFAEERASFPDSPIADESAGSEMLYSSGTTGRPKGIRPTVSSDRPIDAPDGVVTMMTDLYGATAETVYLNPAPLYHAAPLKACMAMHRLGATAVVMERFDAESALEAIEHHRVSLAQFVPTHFIRMLKLPEDVRARYDLSSLRTVVHAAAPCPKTVKEAMLDWFGPIIHEYYSGSEGNGGTFISPEEWLTHKGSVGRPRRTRLHICDEAGRELPPRSEGAVYFSGGPTFEYHNDDEKTRESRHPQGWTTLGDVGWVDEEGYLYLTDRKSFMIISGGVNIYPQEIENLLVTHPKVADVAVIGAPHEEMGEEVVAVVQPLDGVQPSDALGAELIAFARSHLSHVKTPRRVDFTTQLPRLDTGKLYKRLLRDRYWSKPQR